MTLTAIILGLLFGICWTWYFLYYQHAPGPVDGMKFLAALLIALVVGIIGSWFVLAMTGRLG